MIIDKNFQRFISEVLAQYSYTPSYLDDNFNIILIIKNLECFVINSEIQPYYDGYIKSSASKETIINRAVNRIVVIAKQYENN